VSKLSEIKERCDKATEGPWTTGYTIITPQTRRWSKERIRENDIIENGLVFSQFTAMDNGASRQLVCSTLDAFPDYREDNVKFITHARSDIPYLLEVIYKFKDGLNKRSTCMICYSCGCGSGIRNAGISAKDFKLLEE